MKIVGQVHVKNKIVCAWCGGPTTPRGTKPALARAYYECQANCNPNNGRERTRTIFGIAMRPGPGPQKVPGPGSA